MLFVLDTNHVTELAYQSAAGERLRKRILKEGAEVVTTVITVEEELQGWLARVRSLRTPTEQIPAYQKLMQRVQTFARWVVLELDGDAATRFQELRRQGIRIGSMDLKLACIALAHDATVLTRNSVDFLKVPGLRCENWLD